MNPTLPNHSIEPTEASRSGQSQSVAQRRLASAAHADRSVQPFKGDGV
jgi:hypothetical protein